MTKEELKNKYSAFITEISEILGLGKPVDILKLCATTDLFFQLLEKHIAELEDLIHAERKRQEQCDDIHLKKIAELEKENAELKKKNLATQDAVTMQMYTNKANKEIAGRQLTKAKEIIKNFLLMAKVEHLKDRYETVDEAEQFLKDSEVEK